MKVLERNKVTLHYCLYLGKLPVTDEDGNETGEPRIVYTPPVKMQANISAATGFAQTEQFGNLADYDKVIVTDNLSCPLDESSVLFIDVPPSFDDDGCPLYDYIVKRVARSLNSVSIAASKVTVS